MKIFAGSASKKLAERISEKVGIPLSRAEVMRFENSEVKVTIKENVFDQTAVIVQSTDNPTDANLMELFFFADALRRQQAKKIIGVIPYFGYARQDAAHREGECISVNVIIKFLENVGFDSLYCINLHDQATEGVFTVPFKSLEGLPVLTAAIAKYDSNDKPSPEQYAIISPDQGGVERARTFGNVFFSGQAFSLAVSEKKRNLEVKHQSVALDLYGNVSDKTAIIVDDIITSGKTFMNAAKLCKERGAKKVYAAIAHNELNQSSFQDFERSDIEMLFTTDTIENQITSKKTLITSVDSVIAAELKKYINL